MYTLYGQMLEQYHHDGRGYDLIANLYQQRIQTLSQIQSTVTPASISSCGKSLDLELISKTVDMERRRNNHDEALKILSDAFNNADKGQPR